MKTGHFAWGVILLLVALGTDSFAQRVSDEGVEELDAYLELALRAHELPGLVALVTNDRHIIYEGAFGKMDVGNDTAMEADAIFRIASMTKPITSLGIMMLVEDGVLNLEDRVSGYLDSMANREVFTSFNFDDGSYDSVPAEIEMTVRHLLTHTAGLAYGFNSPELARLSNGDRISNARAYPLLHEPGEKWTYGISTRVLGDLIEERTGRGLFDFLFGRVLDPLGMADTFFSVPASATERVVTWHQRDGGSLTEIPNAGQLTSPENGDGGLYSTARDYARFVRLFLNAGRTDAGVQLVDPQVLGLMGRNHIGDLRVESQDAALPLVSRVFPAGAGVDTFGLGFQITEATRPSMRSVGSMAWGGLFNTKFWIDRDKNIAAVLLMQLLPFEDRDAVTVLDNFERRVYQHLQP